MKKGGIKNQKTFPELKKGGIENQITFSVMKKGHIKKQAGQAQLACLARKLGPITGNKNKKSKKKEIKSNKKKTAGRTWARNLASEK